ncbi:MAG: helix-turn-helix domain-containing protein [Acidobacteriota bacterium]
MKQAHPVTIIDDPRHAAAMLGKGRSSLLRELQVPHSAQSLARRLAIPRQKLNYHLRVLERAGLVECVEERRKGNCRERILRATAQSFSLDLTLLGDLGASPTQLSDRFSAAYLMASASQSMREVSVLERSARARAKRQPTLTIAAAIRLANAARRDQFVQELTDALARLTAKYHDESTPNVREYRLLAIAHPEPRAEKQNDWIFEEVRNASRHRRAAR